MLRIPKELDIQFARDLDWFYGTTLYRILACSGESREFLPTCITNRLAKSNFGFTGILLNRYF
jgi:hypothetical protein